MVRAFRLSILNFLREHNAITAVIDVKTPFLTELDTVEKRKAFKQALDTLSNEKMIVVSGSYDFLNWKLINGLYPIDDKIIEAKITARGLAYEPPREIVSSSAETEAGPQLDMPLPPAVKTISKWLGGGTKEVTEQRLKRKMKKMGAKDTHLDFETPSHDPLYQTRHVPAVTNPFIDDSFDNHENDEQPGDEQPDFTIPLGSKVLANSKKGGVINTILKWVLIIIALILVVLIALIFKANS